MAHSPAVYACADVSCCAGRNATCIKGMYARHCCVQCAFAGGTTGSKDRQHVWAPVVVVVVVVMVGAAGLGVELGAAAAAARG